MTGPFATGMSSDGLAPTSCDRVLATPELLEQILIHLPLQPLVRTKAVNHHFHNVIKASPALEAFQKFLANYAGQRSTGGTLGLDIPGYKLVVLRSGGLGMGCWVASARVKPCKLATAPEYILSLPIMQPNIPLMTRFSTSSLELIPTAPHEFEHCKGRVAGDLAPKSAVLSAHFNPDLWCKAAANGGSHDNCHGLSVDFDMCAEWWRPHTEDKTPLTASMLSPGI